MTVQQLAGLAQTEYFNFLAKLGNTSAKGIETNFNISFDSDLKNRVQIYFCTSIQEVVCNHGYSMDFDEIQNDEFSFTDENGYFTTFIHGKYYDKKFNERLLDTCDMHQSFLDTIQEYFNDVIESIENAEESYCDCPECEQDRYETHCDNQYDDMRVY